MYENLEGLREEYLYRRNDYEEIQKIVCQKLEIAIKKQGIKCQIEARIKDVYSFLKKVLKKGYKSPLTEIRDQIGFRIIIAYEHELDKIIDVITHGFNVHNRENKLDSLEYDQLGYLGVHYEVSLKEPHNISEKHYNSYIFEIQVHTKAQNLWSSVSHQLLYKSSSVPSSKIQRSIYRLVALIEIFDKEVNVAQHAIINQPDFPELRLLTHLEKKFCLFTWKSFDKEFSIQNLSFLKGLLKQDEVENFESLIESFVNKNYDKLNGLFTSYSNDTRVSSDYDKLMLFQPESLLIFERLDKNMFKLHELWSRNLPLELLKFLATIWGKGLPAT